MKANVDKIKRMFIGEKRNDNVLIRLLIIGLILFSYASLFRCSYAAFILKPMYFLYLYAEVEKKV